MLGKSNSNVTHRVREEPEAVVDLNPLLPDVRSKQEVFRPEFVAADAGLHNKVTVGFNCSNVVHSPLLQYVLVGQECIQSYQCPQGMECLLDSGFQDKHGDLAWMQRKSCTGENKRWENTGTVAVMVILVFVVMVAITVPFLICDIKRIKAESAEEELADDSANECADDQENKQQTGHRNNKKRISKSARKAKRKSRTT